MTINIKCAYFKEFSINRNAIEELPNDQFAAGWSVGMDGMQQIRKTDKDRRLLFSLSARMGEPHQPQLVDVTYCTEVDIDEEAVRAPEQWLMGIIGTSAAMMSGAFLIKVDDTKIKRLTILPFTQQMITGMTNGVMRYYNTELELH